MKVIKLTTYFTGSAINPLISSVEHTFPNKDHAICWDMKMYWIDRIYDIDHRETIYACPFNNTIMEIVEET